MSFGYDEYFFATCFAPILSSLLGIAILVASGIGLFRKKNIQSLLALVFALCLLPFALMNISVLARGSVYLLFEKEENAVTISGQIEETLEPAYYPRPEYMHCVGETVIMNGEKYHLLRPLKDMRAGDNVEMQVLPRSHFVLEVVKLNVNGQPQSSQYLYDEEFRPSVLTTVTIITGIVVMILYKILQLYSKKPQPPTESRLKSRNDKGLFH